ncbi:MAG TPA: hypothetical protein V6C64_03640 [Microcoleaceae cyanobacterium]
MTFLSRKLDTLQSGLPMASAGALAGPLPTQHNFYAASPQHLAQLCLKFCNDRRNSLHSSKAGDRLYNSIQFI